MIKDNKIHCSICGKKSEERICKNCTYLLKNGASEETIKSMLSNDPVKKIWKENKKIAEKLAYAYYDSILENYDARMKNDSKENFGFNTFSDGINISLDIIMPLFDQEMQERVKAKIDSMVEIRNKNKNE